MKPKNTKTTDAPSSPTKAEKSPTLPPQRGPTHRVDTVAFRKLLNHLKPDWLVRHMEERDYGIDLQLELFDDRNPTGVMVFGQLKGTEKSFEDEKNFQLSVDTILYAELFSAPFFLFRTSIQDNKTRFIWLQKYIETMLNQTPKKWRSQGDRSIVMPPENDLVVNSDRFIKLARSQIREQQALKFLRIESVLALHGPHVLDGEFKVAFYCSSEAKKIEELELFIVDDDMNGRATFATLSELYKLFDEIALKNEVTTSTRDSVKKCLDVMNTIKLTYLGEGDIQAFTTAGSGFIYY